MDENAPAGFAPVDVLHLMVPPYVAHLELVRAAASHAADGAGLSPDDRDDVCLAVDELCQLVIAATDFAILVVFTAQPGAVLARVVGRPRDDADVRAMSGLSAAVLSRAVDYFALDPSGDTVEGVVVKCRARTRRT
jgi:hypothetical protein